MSTSTRERLGTTALRMALNALVGERQRLRARGALPKELEANRREIVRRQWELAAALLKKR
ncbi:MAG: hypothetical protein ABR583_08295 [Gaiellaceae bacterium]